MKGGGLCVSCSADVGLNQKPLTGSEWKEAGSQFKIPKGPVGRWLKAPGCWGGTYRGGPAAAVVVPPTGKHHHPDERHDEAEDGHEHDPALRVRRHHQCARHQDPHQAAEDLQEEHVM